MVDTWNYDSEIIYPSRSNTIASRDDSSVNSTQTSSTVQNNSDNNPASPGVALGIVRTPSEKKSKKRRPSTAQTAASINYRGINIYQASEQGNLPLCVLLWGMASAKRVNLMVPDGQGNNPLHFAALAESSEVATFLLQQTRGYLTDDIKLVDSRNTIGETPLLRAVSTGNFSLTKALIDEGSDMLATDFQGNSVFTKVAKAGHIWCLNFMYNLICSIHGPQVAMELMSAVDNEAHSPLDWAADFGDINVIEFFIRKGLNPYRHDHMNRGPLYWAVKANRVEACRFLVHIGCDPYQKDTIDQTPMSMAMISKNIQLIKALKSSNQNKDILKLISEEEIISMTHVAPHKTPRLYTKSTHHSFAIYHKNPSSVTMTFVYFLLFSFLWLLIVIIPSYVAIIIIALGGFFISSLVSIASPSTRSTTSTPHNVLPTSENFLFQPPPTHLSFSQRCAEQFQKTFREIVEAKEQGLGLYLSCWLFYGIYILTCYFYTVDDENSSSHDITTSLESFQDITFRNIFHIEGDIGGTDMLIVLYIAMGSMMLSLLTWIYLVWYDRNPGIVDYREEDFEEVLIQSFYAQGAPNHKQFCRTTFVKKPLRSKYCRKTGAVIARFDHHCIWLNATIGFHNHRLFLFFIMELFFTTALGACIASYALYTSVGPETPGCFAVAELFNREYFFVFTLAIFLGVASLVIFALVCDQWSNIFANLTTNEKINRHKYPWLDVMDDGKKCSSKFDRGMMNNAFEFLRWPGYDVDYMRLYTLSPELTQENMRLNSTRMSDGTPITPRGAGGGDNLMQNTYGSSSSLTAMAAVPTTPTGPTGPTTGAGGMMTPPPNTTTTNANNTNTNTRDFGYNSSHGNKVYQGQSYANLSPNDSSSPMVSTQHGNIMNTPSATYYTTTTTPHSPRNSLNQPQYHLTSSHHARPRPPSDSSGPPSIDLEMTVTPSAAALHGQSGGSSRRNKPRGDSMDGSDTSSDMV